MEALLLLVELAAMLYLLVKAKKIDDKKDSGAQLGYFEYLDSIRAKRLKK